METKPLPALTNNKDNSIEKLKTRIKKGKELLDLNIIEDEDQLSSARNQFHNWQKLNYDVLSNLFEDNSVAESYIHQAGGVLTGGASLQRKISGYDSDVKDDINKLESIIERVDNMPENKVIKEEHIPAGSTNRDHFSQSGPNSIINVHNGGGLINGRAQRSTWVNNWWGVILLGVVIIVIGALITNFFGLTSSR